MSVTGIAPANPFPLMVTPTPGAGGDWVRDNRGPIRSQLIQYGALLFRGFGIDSAHALDRFLQAADFELMDYPRGISPRREISRQIYTSTEVPENLPLPIHTEMSYTTVFPRMLAFCCVTPPKTGGETPLVDMREILEKLPADLVSTLEEKGILYCQYCASASNGKTRLKSWQDMFSTDDKATVAEICQAQGITVEWLKNDVARLTSCGSATRQHPETGEKTWFNQVHIFHPSMSAEFRYIGRPFVAGVVRCYEYLLENFGDRLPPYPYSCAYGDGTPIGRDVILAIRQAIWDASVTFPWQAGDLLLIDNLRVGHGRLPFSGERKILAALIKNF